MTVEEIETADVTFDELVSELYRQLNSSLCLSPDTPKDTACGNIVLALNRLGIRKERIIKTL